MNENRSSSNSVAIFIVKALFVSLFIGLPLGYWTILLLFVIEGAVFFLPILVFLLLYAISGIGQKFVSKGRKIAYTFALFGVFILSAIIGIAVFFSDI